MKSLRMLGNSRVEIVEVPIPEPAPGEVVVRTAMSAVCGSELKGYRGDGSESGNSGHEGAGTIASVGEGVTGLQVGQRVGVSAIAGCGDCAFCAEGRSTWCDGLTFYGSMHAEMFLTSANACHPLPDDVPWDVGVLISGDGLGVPYHTSTMLPSDVRTIAVFGLGPIGLGNVLLHAHLGCRVIGIDLSRTRLDYAHKLGASELIDAGRTDAVARLQELTNGMGVDVAIEAAGIPHTAHQCFASARKGGTVVFNGEQGEIPLSPSRDFIRRDITALGAWFYQYHEFDDMLQLYRDGLAVQDLVSNTFPLEDAAAAFELFAAGKTAKVLLRAE